MPEKSSEVKSKGGERAPRSGSYFCSICLEAFSDKTRLDDHMKTHRELEVNDSSCRMESKPAGVF